MNKNRAYPLTIPQNPQKSKPSLPLSLSRKRLKQSAAFTIVELLIVVVVIAILAAITIVSYNGIANRAKETALKSDLKNGATTLQVAKIDSGSYPSDTSSLKKSDSTTFQYTRTSDTAFCLSATSSTLPGKTFNITEGGTVTGGLCPGDVTIAGSMQSFTSAQCTALTTYTGSNPTAIIGLTDSRGGITRTYQVAKLADNKCWMLTNLRLGSTTGTTTLTPSDSNVATNFTLPQLTTTGSAEFDNPGAYGPVPGDTGAGATNYGYLYNWPAATAGATRTSNPAGSGNAAYSICPANWHLPTGGNWNDTNNEFSNLNARMAGLSGVTDAGYTSGNYYSAARAANWQTTGPFKGVFAGNWSSGSFYGQGGNGYVWSRSAYPSNADLAFFASFTPGVVYPGISSVVRSGVFGVRCLLN